MHSNFNDSPPFYYILLNCVLGRMNIENIQSVYGVCVCVCMWALDNRHENYTHSMPIAGIERREEGKKQ